MIYLFDEKTDRRYDYGWSNDRIEAISDSLTLFSSYDFLLYTDSVDFGNDCDIVFIHESFFQGVDSERKDAAIKIRYKIYNDNKSGKLSLVVFSGSKSSRKIDGSCAFMPVSNFYQNFAFFIEKYKEGTWNLNDIVYGRNSILEKNLSKRIIDGNRQIIIEASSQGWLLDKQQRTLFVKKGYENNLTPPSFIAADTLSLMYEIKENDPVSDVFLHDFVKSNLNDNHYEKIFIPLCFGPTLSDYNGLRLALHIRTTQGQNQFSPIYIYSPVGMDVLIENEYFDVLKTSNVYLIDYSCKGLYDALCQIDINEEDVIRRSLSLVNLQPPKNYEDSHSIANEWAIYRWTQAIGAEIQDESINNIINNVEHNLYFKFLKTLYPPQAIEHLKDADLVIKGVDANMNCVNSTDPRMLFVDDEAERGWYELFDAIIQKNNPNLYVDCLGKDDFVGKSQEEIVDIICNKVKNDNFNIVILDYRLHNYDFNAGVVSDVTGYKALCRIKGYNSGIQVIIFSATNKVWNLQELQRKGADGFIVKESPFNSKDKTFTTTTIKSFVETLSDAVGNRFKKELFEKCTSIISNLKKYKLDTEKYEEAITAFQKQIKLVKGSIPRIDYLDDNSLDITYISCFNVFEILKDKYLVEDNHKAFFVGEEQGCVYKIEDSNSKKKIHGMQSPVLINRLFKQNGNFVRPTLFDFLGSLLVYFSISKPILKDLELERMWKIVDWRNDFIHGTKPHFSKYELLSIINMLEMISNKMKP